MNLTLTAADLRPGDVWLGDDEVTVERVEDGDTRETIPWDGRVTDRVTVTFVRVVGRVTSGPGAGLAGTISWQLQPTLPVEVRRADG